MATLRSPQGIRLGSGKVVKLWGPTGAWENETRNCGVRVYYLFKTRTGLCEFYDVLIY